MSQEINTLQDAMNALGINQENEINWDACSGLYNLNLSEKFIEKFKDRVDWWKIVRVKILTEDFIETHISDLDFDWNYIFRYQSISEDFIEKHLNEFEWDCWENISKYQTLTESFIKKHIDDVDWDCIFKHQNLSDEFIKKYSSQLGYVID